MLVYRVFRRVTRVSLVVLGCVAASAGAQPLVWDSGFAPAVVHRAAADPMVRLTAARDGSFFLTGNATHLASQAVPGIVRLAADGSPDAAFSFAGETLRRGDLVAPLDGGRFLVVHRADYEDGAGAPVVRRYEASGALDASYTEVPIARGEVGIVRGAERMSDGSIVIFGRFSSVGGQAHAGLARFTRTGELDGAYAPDLEMASAEVEDIAAAPDGALIARVSVVTRQMLLRIDANGQRDTGFAAPQSPYGPMLLVQRDGRVIFGGGRPVRLGADGLADVGFDPLPSDGGWMMSYSLAGAVELANGEMVFDVVVFGEWSTMQTLERYTSEGALIGTWPGTGTLVGTTPDGRIVTRTQGVPELSDLFRQGEPWLAGAPQFCVYPQNGGTSIAVQPDLGFAGIVSSAEFDGAGGLWLGGAFSWIDGQARPGLARLLADGTVDAAFAPPLDLGRLWPGVREPDGHAWVYAREMTDAWWRRLRRLDPSGALSPTGTVESDLGRSRARVLGLDRESRILAIEQQSTDRLDVRLVRFDRQTGARIATLPPVFNLDGDTFDLFLPLYLTAARELTDGSIVFAAGISSIDGQSAPHLAKLRPDGSLDTEYVARLAVHGTFLVEALEHDGAAVLLVYGSDPYPQRMVRVRSDGTTDPGFVFEYDGDLRNAPPRELAVLLDGTFVSLHEPLKRWRHDGSRMLTTNAAAGMTVRTVAQAADGDWVIGGEFGAMRLQALTTPGIVIPPVSRSVAAGERAEFSVEIGDSGQATFQWQRDGVDIPGATRSTLVIAVTSTSDAGVYRVVIHVGSATYVSDGVTLTVHPSTAHLVNFSARSRVPIDGPPQIAGFVTAGAAPRRVLLRGVGLQIPGSNYIFTRLADPAIALFAGENLIARDARSARTPAMLAVAAQVGAFDPQDWQIIPGIFVNYDSALVWDIAGGSYTLQTSSPTQAAGISLAEFYDAGEGAPVGFVRNLSLRGRTGPGVDTMIGGFVVRGQGGLRLLVRAVGAELAEFGVPGVLDDPRVRLYRDATAIAVNDGWDDRPADELAQLLATSQTVGAFPLTPGSDSAALIADVLPGTYTVHAESVAGAVGEVLLELYVVDPGE